MKSLLDELEYPPEVIKRFEESSAYAKKLMESGFMMFIWWADYYYYLIMILIYSGSLNICRTINESDQSLSKFVYVFEIEVWNLQRCRSQQCRNKENFYEIIRTWWPISQYNKLQSISKVNDFSMLRNRFLH